MCSIWAVYVMVVTWVNEVIQLLAVFDAVLNEHQ